MLHLLTKSWWSLVLRGAIAVLFGLLAFASPGITAATLVFWIAIFLFIDGLLALFAVIRDWKAREDKWLGVLEGALGIVLAILMFRAPELTLLFVVMYVGIWAIISGISRVAMAIQLRKEIEGELWLAISGVISVLFGILIIAQPGIGVATLMWMLGLFAVLAGIVLIIIGLKVKKFSGRLEEIGEKVAEEIGKRKAAGRA